MAGAFIEIEAMQSLVTCMDGAAADLRGAKGDLAGILGGVDLDTSPPQPLETAASWVETQVPGLRRRLAMAQHIQGSDPKFAKGASIPIDESKISALPPSQAQQNGRDAAAALKAADGKPSADLIAQIRANQDDPYFATALAQQFSPSEIAGLIKQLGATYPGTHMPGADETDEQKDWEKTYRDQLQTLGGVFGTATRTTAPDLKMPVSWTTQWSDVITGEPTSHSDGTDTYGDSLALSLLIKNGTYGTDFLTKITTDAYDYERDKGKDGDAVWGPKTGDNTVWDPDNPSGEPPNRDVMANLLKGLGRNPEAAQAFFYGDTGSADVRTGTDDDDHDKHVPVNERLRYFIKDRLWGRGDVNSDDGDGFGDALRAATTYARGTDAEGARSATIASQAMAMIAEHDGYGAHGWSLIHGESTSGWHMPSALQNDVADIVGSYAPDLFRLYGNGDALGETPPPWTVSAAHGLPGQPTGMALSRSDLKTLLQSMNGNDQAMQTITSSSLAYGQYRTNDLMSQMTAAQKAAVLRGEEFPPLTQYMNASGQVLASITTDAFDGAKSEEEIKNANTEMMNKFLDAAGDFPATDLLKISNPVAGWAFDTVKGELIDHVKGEPVDEASALYSGQANGLTDKLTHNFQNQMLQNGFYDPEVLDLIKQQSPTAQGYTGLPEVDGSGHSPAVRYQDGKPIGFDFSSSAYQNWANGPYNTTTNPNGSTMPGGRLNQDLKEAYVTSYRINLS